VVLELVAEEDDAPAAVQVEIVHVASARRGHQAAHRREDRAGGRDLGADAHALPPEGGAVLAVLAGELGLGDLAAQGLDVLLVHPDAPALAQPFEGKGGARGPGDHDVLAQAVLVLLDPLLQALAERDEQSDRDRAPGDPEQREERPHLLVPDVLEDLLEEGEIAHSIFLGGRSTTRSFSFSHSATSTLMPSERPSLMSFLTGSSPLPGISTVDLPPSIATSRSGMRRTSFFSRTTMSALAEYPARRVTPAPGRSSISTSKRVAPSAVL